MARESMVTRTMKITKGVVLCANPETKEISENEFQLVRHVKEEEILKQLNKYMVEKIPIKILSFEYLLEVYGMKESEFMKYATHIERGIKEAV